MNDNFILEEDKVSIEVKKLISFIEENNSIVEDLSESFHYILNLYNSDITNNISDFNNLAINKMNNFYRKSVENYDFIRSNLEATNIVKKENIERANSFEGGMIK